MVFQFGKTGSRLWLQDYTPKQDLTWCNIQVEMANEHLLKLISTGHIMVEPTKSGFNITLWQDCYEQFYNYLKGTENEVI